MYITQAIMQIVAAISEKSIFHNTSSNIICSCLNWIYGDAKQSPVSNEETYVY